MYAISCVFCYCNADLVVDQPSLRESMGALRINKLWLYSPTCIVVEILSQESSAGCSHASTEDGIASTRTLRVTDSDGRDRARTLHPGLGKETTMSHALNCDSTRRTHSRSISGHYVHPRLRDIPWTELPNSLCLQIRGDHSKTQSKERKVTFAMSTGESDAFSNAYFDHIRKESMRKQKGDELRMRLNALMQDAPSEA